MNSIMAIKLPIGTSRNPLGGYELMNKVALLLALTLILLAIPTANAGPFTATFPGPGSTWHPTGGSYYFWLAGSNVEESFSGTGLAQVDELAMVLPIGAAQNNQDLGFTVSVNGIDVGSFVVPAGDGATIDDSFTFTDIAGAGTYDIEYRVTQPICNGNCGAVTLSDPGSITLSENEPSSVPEPATALLVCTGLLALRRRFRSV